jgi:putative flippase GtrA
MRTFGSHPDEGRGGSGATAGTGVAAVAAAVAFLRRHLDLAIFLLFGGAAAVVNLATGWTLYGAGLMPALPSWFATGAAASAGLIVNFGLNYSFNFRFRARSAIDQFRTFCFVAGLGIVLQSFLASVLRFFLELTVGPVFEFAGRAVHATFAAHCTAVALVAIYSFPAHKYLSFNVGVRARMLQWGLLARR